VLGANWFLGPEKYNHFKDVVIGIAGKAKKRKKQAAQPCTWF